MNPIEQFWRNFEEIQDLTSRIPNVFPIRRNMAALKKRHEAADRNVVAYYDDDGITVTHYELNFTLEQRQDLRAAYTAARPKPEDDPFFDLASEARVFVGTIERWADSIMDSQAIVVQPQKDRARALQKVATAMEKLDQALSELDSGALGYWYAHIVDSVAKEGMQISEADNALVSMLDNPLRAQVEAGELRFELRRFVAAAVDATKQASDKLPLFDHTMHDERLKTALLLERFIQDHGIVYDTGENGFAAKCLRAMFDIAKVEVEKVSYWLKKAAEHPDSETNWRKRKAAAQA